MTGDYNDFGSFVGGSELNLCFPDFLGKNEKIQLGSAGRFLQNLRITKFSGEIEIFFVRDGSMFCSGRTGISRSHKKSLISRNRI